MGDEFIERVAQWKPNNRPSATSNPAEWCLYLSRVRTLEGVKRYKLSIGSPITTRFVNSRQPVYNGAGIDRMKDLMAGRQTSVSVGELDDLMTKLLSAPSSVNLSRLSVEGENNLFRRHAREIPRSKMPQLPSKSENLKAFSDALAKQGITGEMEKVDPRTIAATQNELDSVKVAEIYVKVKTRTLNRDAVFFVSKDGFVLDGHHRWAAFALARVTGTEGTMTVIRLNAGIDTLLEIANSVSGPRKTLGSST